MMSSSYFMSSYQTKNNYIYLEWVVIGLQRLCPSSRKYFIA